jgi:hypothetical protein
MPRRTKEERNIGYYDEKIERMDRADRAFFQEKEALRCLRSGDLVRGGPPGRAGVDLAGSPNGLIKSES